MGAVTYTRHVPVDDDAERELRRRTLTKLYNDRPTWLRDAHHALDETVFAAYGWRSNFTDANVLTNLLALNLAEP